MLPDELLLKGVFVIPKIPHFSLNENDARQSPNPVRNERERDKEK